MNAKVIDVHIGEVKIARHGEILKTILGSCVGIGFIWKSRGICGLAHCLLPESPVKTFEIGGRFVDQAIHSLIALMKIRPDDVSDIEAIIAGGGNMTQPNIQDTSRLIGSHNFLVAERELKILGVRLIHIENGGEEGRKIFLDSRDYSYRVEKIPRIIGAA